MTNDRMHVLSPDPWSRRLVPAWPVLGPAPSRAVWFSVLFSALVLAAAPGCQKTLIRENDARTQYDRYDAQRNQLSEQWIVDEFGQRRPNLRGRLTPKPD